MLCSVDNRNMRVAWSAVGMNLGRGGLVINERTARISLCVYLYFFFQAEDGIRDYKVTGVQTCALPIWGRVGARASSSGSCYSNPNLDKVVASADAAPAGAGTSAYKVAGFLLVNDSAFGGLLYGVQQYRCTPT